MCKSKSCFFLFLITYMAMSRYQKAGRSHNIKIDNSYYERVEVFKYLWTTLTGLKYQTLIQPEIKSRFNSGNACYHSVQNCLSSSLLSKNIQNKIYRNIILPVVWRWCETWSLTSSERRRLRVFENRLLRTFGQKRDEVTESAEKLHNEKF
jgi:hypothetical protein